MEAGDIYANHWTDQLFLVLLYAMVAGCFLIALWTAVARGFSPYWTVSSALLVIGLVLVFSPAFVPIPVHYWDWAVRIGKLLIAGGVLARLSQLGRFGRKKASRINGREPKVSTTLRAAVGPVFDWAR